MINLLRLSEMIGMRIATIDNWRILALLCITTKSGTKETKFAFYE
jgi:hypothetical protein